jgi:hypothetical protein
VANVADGLAAADPSVDSDEGFNAALLRAAEAARDEEPEPGESGASWPQTRHEIEGASADEVRASILEADAAERERRTPVEPTLEERNAQRWAQREHEIEHGADFAPYRELRARQVAEAEENAQLRADRDEDDAFDILATSREPFERITAWARLGTDARIEAIEQGITDSEEAQMLERAADAAFRVGERETAAQQERDAFGRYVQDAAGLLTEWSVRNGLDPSSPEASRRYSEVLGVAARLGHLPTTDAASFDRAFRHAEAVIDEAERAAKTQLFQRQILEMPSTSVAEGLTQLTANGHTPIQPRELPPLRFRDDRVTKRAASRGRTTPQDIRQAVSAESPLTEGWNEMQAAAGRLFHAEEERRKASEAVW